MAQQGAGRSGRFQFSRVSFYRSGRYTTHSGVEFPITRRQPFSGLIYSRGFDDSFLIVLDDLINTSLSVETVGDTGLENTNSTAASVNVISELASESVSTSGGQVGAISESSADSLTSAQTSVESVVDLVAVIDSLVSTAAEIQSVSEAVLDSVASTHISVETLAEVSAEALASAAQLVNALANVALEEILTSTVAVETITEAVVEALTLSTSMQNVASLVEGGGDVLVNTAGNSQSISESQIENLLAVSLEAQLVAESLAEIFISVSTEQSAFVDDYAGQIDDLFAVAVFLVFGLDDLVIAPSPVPPYAPPGGGGSIDSYRKKKARQPRTRRQKVSRAALERSAERVLTSHALPQHYTKGAKKAFQQFQDFYGPLKGRRIFLQKALEQGQGNTLAEKVNDVYATGTTVDQRKKMEVEINTQEKSVKVLSGHPVNPNKRKQIQAQGVKILSQKR